MSVLEERTIPLGIGALFVLVGGYWCWCYCQKHPQCRFRPSHHGTSTAISGLGVAVNSAVCSGPCLVSVPDFASAAECDDVRRLGSARNMGRIQVRPNDSDSFITYRSFDCDRCSLSCETHSLVWTLTDRVIRHLGLQSLSAQENPPTLQRYRAGQRIGLHMDMGDSGSSTPLITAILYLTTHKHGGSTFFPHVDAATAAAGAEACTKTGKGGKGRVIQPIKGTLLLFTTPAFPWLGSRTSEHEGTAPLKGEEKWILKWKLSGPNEANQRSLCVCHCSNALHPAVPKGKEPLL